MNKLLGFFELKDSMLPTISWNIYENNMKLDSNILWTVRTAVYRGDDLNLPRKIGVSSEEAMKFALETSKKYGENGMVIYYPYFIAEKSGTLNVFNDRVIIEAVKKDLWNMVTYSKRDVTIIETNKGREYFGDKYFLNDEEITKITSYVGEVKKIFRDDLLEGRSVLLEWSYAYNCDINRNKVGKCYLVFYEARTI